MTPATPDRAAGVARARSLRKQPTDVERRFWVLLRDRRLEGFKFRRQHPIGPFVADFACVEARLVIELDGGQHAVTTSKDACRSEYLQVQGFKVLRFWDNDVLRNREAVLQVIHEELKARET